MATQATERVEAPVSIYFGLKEGQSANLEVVAEAAIAWVAALREMANAIEPGLQVSVEILDGERGSLWLNTLTAIEKKLDILYRGGEQFPRAVGACKGTCDHRDRHSAERDR